MSIKRKNYSGPLLKGIKGINRYLKIMENNFFFRF